MQFFKDRSPGALTAGFVAVLVGFTSSVAIVFQAALAFGATTEQITSWMWALGLGMGLCTAVPSLILKRSVMVAWSTPGAAALATIGSALRVALRDDFHREAALITFLVTLSGVVVAGVGSAFWRVIAGALALLVQRAGKSHFDLPQR